MVEGCVERLWRYGAGRRGSRRVGRVDERRGCDRHGRALGSRSIGLWQPVGKEQPKHTPAPLKVIARLEMELLVSAVVPGTDGKTQVIEPGRSARRRPAS